MGVGNSDCNFLSTVTSSTVDENVLDTACLLTSVSKVEVMSVLGSRIFSKHEPAQTACIYST